MHIVETQLLLKLIILESKERNIVDVDVAPPSALSAWPMSLLVLRMSPPPLLPHPHWAVVAPSHRTSLPML
jgi:hypothetical protein